MGKDRPQTTAVNFMKRYAILNKIIRRWAQRVPAWYISLTSTFSEAVRISVSYTSGFADMSLNSRGSCRTATFKFSLHSREGIVFFGFDGPLGSLKVRLI